MKIKKVAVMVEEDKTRTNNIVFNLIFFSRTLFLAEPK